MHRIFSVLLVFLFGFSLHSQTGVSRIGLVNPTVGNLTNLLHLIDNDFIKLDSVEIIGIFHHTQEEAISTTAQFLEKHPRNNVSIKVLKGNIGIHNLFEQNECTSEFSEIFNSTDAILLFGGADIPPVIYGEETLLTTDMVTAGKNWELSFLFHLIGGSQNKSVIPLLASKPGFPVLGICLGMQEMNVAAGGTLYQDIPSQIYGYTTYEDILRNKPEDIHKNYWNNVNNEHNCSFVHLHPIKIFAGSFLDYDTSAPNPVVVSVHHQSVKKMGTGFSVAATSIDGKIVEAMQHRHFKNVVGIQFHTDFASLYNKEKEFETQPGVSVKLDDTTHRFHQLFWNDFSERLKQQLKTK